MGCLHRDSSDAESLFLLWHLSISAILISTAPDISVWILLQKRNRCISKWWLDFVCLLVFFFFFCHFTFNTSVILGFFWFFFPNILFLSVICPTKIVCNLYCCYPQHNLLLPLWSRDVLSSVFKWENLKLKVRIFFHLSSPEWMP